MGWKFNSYKGIKICTNPGKSKHVFPPPRSATALLHCVLIFSVPTLMASFWPTDSCSQHFTTSDYSLFLLETLSNVRFL